MRRRSARDSSPAPRSAAALLDDARRLAEGITTLTSQATLSAPSPVKVAGDEQISTTVEPEINATVVERLAKADGTVHVAPLIVQGSSRRALNAASKQSQRVASEALREKRRVERERRREVMRQERELGYLPAAGERRPQALRTYRPAKATSTQVTADVAAYAYPFLAEAGLGSRGILIGADAWSGAAFVFDPWELYQAQVVTNPNILIAGVIGRGKSTIAKSLTTRSIAVGRKVYVAADPKGEWTTVARAVGGQSIELGGSSSSRLNPLDAPPRPDGVSDDRWNDDVRRRRLALLKALIETTLGRSLLSVETTSLDVALDAVVATKEVPLLGLVLQELHTPSRPVTGATIAQLTADGREIAHALRRLVDGDLKGLFDGPSTVQLDADVPMVSIDMSQISGSDTMLALVCTCAAAWIESAVANPDGGQRYIIYDEAWRLLKTPALLARMQADWKLSRARGLSNVMIIHRLSDLDAVGDEKSEARNLALGLLADCSIKIIYAQERGEATATGRRLGFSDVEIEQLPGLQRGQGLWRVGERSFLVNHRVTPGELALFDTNQRMGA